MASPMPPLQFSTHQYAHDHRLQHLSIWRVPPPLPTEPQHRTATLPSPKKYWLIFIHGGGWRDPTYDLSHILPTINHLLLHHPALLSRITAFASLNYRLSPHPDFPSHSPNPVHQAGHPDHVDDIRTGLAFLAREFGLGGPGTGEGEGAEYILSGHSAGAMMAYQTLFLPPAAEGLRVPHPAAVIGFMGVYDLVRTARKGEMCRDIVLGVFGEDEGEWKGASAAVAGHWRRVVEQGGRVPVMVLAQSVDDELVDMGEMEGMARALREGGVKDVLVFGDLRGRHSEVMIEGEWVVRVIGRTVEALDGKDGGGK